MSNSSETTVVREALSQQEAVTEQQTVAVVLKNTDPDEGRGPFLFHGVFVDLPAAQDFIRKQAGTFGSAQQCISSNKDSFGHIRQDWNGYRIIVSPVIKGVQILTAHEKEHLRKKADLLRAELLRLDRSIEEGYIVK